MWIFLHVILLLVALSMGDDVDPASKPVKKVLAFGGNGFIGSEVLNNIFEDPSQYYAVTLVSRGNWYFDSESRIKPKLHKHIICDREESDMEYCPDLVAYAKEAGKVDIVLDFSAYNSQTLEATLELLKDTEVGIYVYISSDSIYEVCRGSVTPRLAKEDDDKRPESEEEQNMLIEQDNYGNDKLQGEELLRDPKNKVPYVIFRLPDVLGPRDTTDRWWTYQIWIQFYSFLKVPLLIPTENKNLLTSYVYVKDVAQAILLAVNTPNSWNDVYNLGMEEPLSLQGFFERLSSELNVQIATDTGDYNVFPSVTRGAVSIEKAKTVLGFKPTTWDVVFRETVQFYKDAFYKFPSERDDAVNQLTRFVVPKHRKGEFLRLIDELSANPEVTVEQFMANKEIHVDDQVGEGISPEQLFEEMMTRTEL